MKPMQIGLILGAIGICTGLIYSVLFGGSSRVPDAKLQKIVFVDTVTGDEFLMPARSSTEVHPQTGERTLIPGMYCEKCQRWKPAAPLDVMQTSHAVYRCPIHRIPLVREGILPD